MNISKIRSLRRQHGYGQTIERTKFFTKSRATMPGRERSGMTSFSRWHVLEATFNVCVASCSDLGAFEMIPAKNTASQKDFNDEICYQSLVWHHLLHISAPNCQLTYTVRLVLMCSFLCTMFWRFSLRFKKLDFFEGYGSDQKWRHRLDLITFSYSATSYYYRKHVSGMIRCLNKNSCHNVTTSPW